MALSEDSFSPASPTSWSKRRQGRARSRGRSCSPCCSSSAWVGCGSPAAPSRSRRRLRRRCPPPSRRSPQPGIFRISLGRLQGRRARNSYLRRSDHSGHYDEGAANDAVPPDHFRVRSRELSLGHRWPRGADLRTRCADLDLAVTVAWTKAGPQGESKSVAGRQACAIARSAGLHMAHCGALDRGARQ